VRAIDEAGADWIHVDGRDRYRHRAPPRARAGRARGSDDLQVGRSGHRANASLNQRLNDSGVGS
jgi:hypothetical protein